MADTVLLTGITGFLGGHIALALLKKGYSVRGTLRNPGPQNARMETTLSALEKAGADLSRVELEALDLSQDEGWEHAATGVTYIIHAASPFVTTMPKDPDVLIRPAVEGTERVIRAGQRAGVSRIVLTSSAVAIVNGRGPNGPPSLGPEDWSDPENGKLNAYGQSKNLAERRAWDLVKDGPELAVINPGFIVGPLWDDDPGTSGALFQRMLSGAVPMLPRLHLHIVDVRDLAEIHVAAMTDPLANGQRNIAAFTGMSLTDIAKTLKTELSTQARKVATTTAPDWLVRLLSLFDGDIRANIHELGYAPDLDGAAGARLLGRPPITATASIVDMARSLIERNLV